MKETIVEFFIRDAKGKWRFFHPICMASGQTGLKITFLQENRQQIPCRTHNLKENLLIPFSAPRKTN